MKDEYAVQSTGARARGERATWRALLRYAARASKRCGLLCTPPRPTLADALADSHVAQWKYFLMITMALPKNNDYEVSAPSVEELEEVVRLRFHAELARLIKEVAREWGKLPIVPQTQRTSLRLPSPISTRRHAS